MAIEQRLKALYESGSDLNESAIVEAMSPTGGVFLDLGCGEGSLTRRAADRMGVSRVVGVETEPGLAAAARDKQIEIINSDLGEPLPFTDGSIDAVLSNQVIEHLNDTDLFLREIRRVLAPGGYAVISTNNLASWHNVAALVMGWQPMPSQVSDEVLVGNPASFMDGHAGAPYPQHRRIFTNRALRELASHHGLVADLDVTAGYYPFGPRMARRLTRLDRRHGAFIVQRFWPR